MERYGDVVEYKEAQPIQYPDFEITYTGKEHVNSPAFKPGFTHKYFVIRTSEETTKITWRSGTGDIGETPFVADGKKFFLDLSPRKDGRFINSGKQDMIIHDEQGYTSYLK